MRRAWRGVSLVISSLALSLSLGGFGCGEVKHPGGESPVATRSAVFTNGDFESDVIGANPTGWTISAFLNPSITDTRPNPQTVASLRLAAGGYLATHVVGGALESQPDPDLGTGASLRYPKYGLRAAVVNYASASQPGNNQNVNQLTQTMTTTNADVDPADNKIHIRFAVAPVLYSGGHPYTQQPYYYVELDNVTKGTQLYQDFNASAQAGVPWKTVGTIYYTDWSLVDIAPGNAGIAVGDQVKLLVIAGGCSAGGHFGRVYVDGIGSAIPGIYASATGPASANAGSDITYVISYKNGGTATALATKVNVVIPVGTTYKANNLTGACAGVAVGGTGTVACSLGALAAGASGSFSIAVNINAGTAGTTVTNGNYSISATGISALLGPKVLTAVTSNVTYADVATTKTDGVAAVGWGQTVTYKIVASNAGPGAAAALTIMDAMPVQFTGATWTCSGSGGGTCVASGSGNISSPASLPVGATVTYVVQGSIVAGTGTGSVTNTATATLGGGAVDPDGTNNTAVDTDAIGVLRTLSISKTNPNGGSVISVPASISCGTSCTAATGAFVNGTAVVLTASPVSGATFLSWGGACAGSSSTCTLTVSADVSVTAAFSPPPTVNLVTGDQQGAALGTPFATPLQVRVLDSAGAPIVNATVLFSAPTSGASAVLSSSSVMTNASGVATITAIANGTAGAFAVVAALSGTPVSGSFSLWNFGAATSLVLSSGSPQTAVVGTTFPAALLATVRDAASQPVPNATVSFAAPTVGARATFGMAATTSVTTNASGQASISANAGQIVGSYGVTATASGVAAPVTFVLGNTAGPAATLTATSGGGQLALVGTVFAAPLVVTVRDSFGNAVPNVVVALAAPTGGASAVLATPSASTDAGGAVSIGAMANGIVGGYSVTVSAVGVPTPVGFSLTNFGTLVIAPSLSTVFPGGSLVFTASGDPASSYSYVLTTNGSAGSIIGSSGAYTAGRTGAVSDVVQVVDSLGRSATAMVTVGPSISVTPDPASVPPRGIATFVALGGSGAGFVYSLASNASGGSIDVVTGVYTAGINGSVIDVVTVTDSLGNTATVNVTVNEGVNLTPLVPHTAPQGTIDFTASHGSGAGYTYAVTSNQSGATIGASGRFVAGTTGNVTDTVTATDSLGNTASTTIIVGPGVTLTASGTTTPPRGALTFAASGGSGTGFVFILGTNASGGTIGMATGAYVAGSADVVVDTVVVTDSLGNRASANIAVGVGVSITPASPATPPRGHVNLVAAGGSGVGFAYAVVTSTTGASVDPISGLYTAGATGSAVDVIRATDSLGNSATVAVSVGTGLTLNPAAPSLAPEQSQLFTATGGSTTGFMFALATNASGATLNASSGAYVAGPTGSTTDVVTVTDSLGNTAIATVRVGPGLAVTPPVVSLAPLGSRRFSVSGGSGDGYRFVIGTNASGGTIDSTTGAYLAGATGSVGDTILVTDSLGNSGTATVTVTPALQATDTTVSSPPRGSLQLAVTGGAGGATFALTTNGSGATLDAVTGAYVAGAVGSTSDLVTVTDANGATVTIRANVGPGVSLAPPNPSAPPRGSLSFTASGGSGTGYRYDLSVNQSGGTIDPTTGAYLAGPTSNVTDIVEAVDSLGNRSSVTTSIGGALAINPSTPQVAPRATIDFAPVGGSGRGFVYSLVTNMSGAFLVPETGRYVAGSTPNVPDTVMVTDSVGNSATATVSVGPGILVAPAVSTTPPGGTVILSASGGSGDGYVFALTTDLSGGTVNSSSGLYVAGGLADVIDTVTVTDSLGNTASATVDVGSGVKIAAGSTSTPPRGSVVLTATGGSGTYSFTLRVDGSGASVVSTTGRYTAGSLPNTTDFIEVIDDLGNHDGIQINVGDGVSIAPPSPAFAPGGGVTFTASGGSSTGFVFTLTTNGSLATLDPLSGAYRAGVIDDTIDVVTVTDSLGNQDSVTVAIGNRVALSPPTSDIPPRGQVVFAASGGSGTGYTFSMVTNSSGAMVDAVTGVYQAGGVPNVTDVVGVVDSLGMAASAEVAVGAGLILTPTSDTTAPGGSIRFAVTGGSGTGQRFVLTANGSGGSIAAAAGNYEAGAAGNTTDVVTVTDSLGNSATATITIGAALTLAPADATVPPRGSVAMVAMGGATPYVFAVSTNNSHASGVNISTGAYVAGPTPSVMDVVTVTDANGVSVTATVNVGPGISLTPGSPQVAAGGSIQFVASGGAGSGFTFALVDNSAGGSVDPTTGVYTASASAKAGRADVVEVSDSLGNTARVTVRPKVVTVSASGGSHGCNYASGGADFGGVSTLLAAALALMRGARSKRRPPRSQ